MTHHYYSTSIFWNDGTNVTQRVAGHSSFFCLCLLLWRELSKRCGEGSKEDSLKGIVWNDFV